MRPPLPCGCDPCDTARCPRLVRLRDQRDVLSRAALAEEDPNRRALLWKAHHEKVREITAHLMGGVPV